MTDVCVIGTRGIPHFVGGIETICRELYPRIKQIEPAFKILILARLPDKGRRKFNYCGVEVKVLSAPKVSGLETFIHTFIAIIYARLFIHPKIIHLHGIGPGFFSGLARLLLFRVVVTHHSTDFNRPKWKWHAKLILKFGEVFSCLFANKVIFVSKALLEDVNTRLPFLRQKRVLIRNAGALDFFKVNKSQRKLPDQLADKEYILAVGRLDETKRFHDLIEAFESMSKENLVLVIVGSNYIEDEYVKKIHSLSSEKVIFLGTKVGNDLKALYDNAALLVNPSSMEGFCLVIAEGLSAKTPILASDIPPHREFELNESCYFPTGDVATLSKKLSEPNFEAFRSLTAEEIQKNNTWNVNAKMHLNVFKSIVKDTY